MKKNRHQKLKELVEQYEIETQDELAEKLKEAGFDVTQATVSRDIRELKLTKVPTGNGRQKYTILVHPGIEGWVCFHGCCAEYSCGENGIRHGYGRCGSH